MQFPSDDYAYGDPSPEEIALDSWLDDSGPYVSLSDGDSTGADELDDE